MVPVGADTVAFKSGTAFCAATPKIHCEEQSVIAEAIFKIRCVSNCTDPPSSPPSSSPSNSPMKGCQKVHDKVVVNQAGFPTRSVLDTTNIVISGDTIQSRMCTLKGAVKFSAMAGSAQAQIDPNLRDPSSMTPLCFPMATMTFFAGIVSDKSSSIQSNVIVQVEPHGHIRILGKSINTDVTVRLDGITYAPFMQFNEPPAQCGDCKCAATPAFHVTSATVSHSVTLLTLFRSSGSPLLLPFWKRWRQHDEQWLYQGVTSLCTSLCMTCFLCHQYCTPPAYDRSGNGGLKPKDCQCDMLKRLECWKHENSTMQTAPLRCGQYKQLLRMYKTGNPAVPVGDDVCGKVCAEQLAGL